MFGTKSHLGYNSSRVNKIDYEKKNDYEKGLWLPNLKLLKVDINKYKEDSIYLGVLL
ncbi:hypothetical protein C1645_829641 [Glomus cerebriforme]|uniref:Uncharacterized protein n=1 Tax=Glomus cerebriforme TaxID=658196 RepID=A0A397SJ83_9GLOM|nr:hypothetical protein C1645_829641 [Glomus cerebriforme]